MSEEIIEHNNLISLERFRYEKIIKEIAERTHLLELLMRGFN